MSIKRLNVPLNGGVNVFADPVAIQDGQWQRLKNICTRQNGIIGSRASMSFARDVVPYWWNWDSRTHYGLSGEAAAVENYYTWAKYLRPVRFIFDPNFGEITLVCVTTADVAVYDEVSQGVENPVTVPAGTQLMVTLPGAMYGNGSSAIPSLRCGVLGVANRMPSIITFLGVTYAFNGADNGRHTDLGTDGATPLKFSYYRNNFGSANTDFSPAGACVVRDRVLYFKGPNVCFSDRNEPLVVGYTGTLDATTNQIVPSAANPVVGTNFNAWDTRGIYLGGEELEDITAVAEVSTTADGSPMQSVAMAFTSTHAYMMLGEPLETSEAGDILGTLQINRLNVQAGCVSQATITRTPYGTFWAGPNDVWFMPFGSTPIRVGTSIRPLLEAQPLGMRWKMHAEYADGFYRLSMFKPGQGPTAYDPCGMQMWLDLRDGAPANAEAAKWFGPQEWNNTDGPDVSGDRGGVAGVWCMARDSRENGDGQLYSLQSYSVYGWSASISGMSLCTFDKFNGRDTAAPQASVTPSANQAGQFYEGDVLVPSPNTTDFRSPIWVCIQEGIIATVPNWFTDADSFGIIQPIASTAKFACRYWDGLHVLPGYDAPMVQGDNTIGWSALGKEMMLGDPMVDKLLDGSELGFWAQDRTQVTQKTHAKMDSRSHLLGLATEMTDNVLGSYTGERIWQSNQLTQDPQKRFHGKSMTWECQQDAGIVITTGVNDTITINNFLKTIPAGYYASLVELCAAIATAAGVDTTIGLYGYDRALVGLRIHGAMAGASCMVACDSRLANLLGYSTRQGATVTGTYPDFAYGYESPYRTYTPDMQFSGLNLRYRLFNRRPT